MPRTQAEDGTPGVGSPPLNRTVRQAGLVFVYGAIQELGLLPALVGTTQAARQGDRGAASRRLSRSRGGTLQAQFLAWLLWPLMEGVQRPSQVEGPAAAALAVWTGRHYAFRALERMLRGLMQSALSPALGTALARCYYQAWYVPVEADPPLDTGVYYLDSHDKRLWTEAPVPCGRVDGQAVPCWRQMFIHGRYGHALYSRTYPGDVKVTAVAGEVIDDFEAAVGQPVVHVIVVDREGLSLPWFDTLAARGTAIVTLLKANQYGGVSDFENLSEARSLRDPRTGETTHRVAEGWLPRGEGKWWRCAVARDLDNGRLVVFVTTVPPTAEPNILAIARWYLQRWPAQENSFRDLNALVALEQNFGVKHKRAVANRVQARRREKWEQQLRGYQKRLTARAKQETVLQARVRREEERLQQFVAGLNGRRLQERGTPRRQEQQAHLTTRLGQWKVQQAQVVEQQVALQQKIQVVQAELAALPADAPLWEVDAEKDQIVTHLKGATANAVLWARQAYFGAAYQSCRPATLQRRFLNLEGWMQNTPTSRTVWLQVPPDTPWRADVEEACVHFNQRQIRTVEGKLLQAYVTYCK